MDQSNSLRNERKSNLALTELIFKEKIKAQKLRSCLIASGLNLATLSLTLVE